jgi:hypothetical protein
MTEVGAHARGAAATLARCWDALLTCPLDGDRLCVPSLPAGKGQARPPAPEVA